MQDPQNSMAPSRRTALAIVATILAVPVFYVATHLRSPQAVSAAQGSPAQAAGSAADLPELEHFALSNPTAANRINLSQAYIGRGMMSRALLVLNALVADEPQNALAWNNLCVAHTLQQEYNDAIGACETGVRADGSMQLIKNNLRWAQDEKAKVLVALSEAAHTPPSKRTADFYLADGLNHLHVGEYDQALTDWQLCLQTDPHNSAAENNIGMVQMLQAHYVEAESSFRKAVVLDPASQLSRNNLAWAQQAQRPAGR